MGGNEGLFLGLVFGGIFNRRETQRTQKIFWTSLRARLRRGKQDEQNEQDFFGCLSFWIRGFVDKWGSELPAEMPMEDGRLEGADGSVQKFHV